MNDPHPEAAAAIAVARRLATALDDLLLGQRRTVEHLLAAYAAGGHVLLEGLPGVGKTRLARSFAACLGVPFQRIQFTPDLMPADVVGTNVYDQASGTFRLVRGPVFTRVLMADEINRTPPKTQAALLEAMQDRQATIDGTSHPLEEGFFVVATQNPVELEGVYPLPEAQLDRFLMRIVMGAPEERRHELELYRRAAAGRLAGDAPGELPPAVADPGDALLLRGAARRVHASDELLDYLLRLAEAVRGSPAVEIGVSPRGALALLEAARAGALLEERAFVVPDDFKRFLAPCWAHRIILTAEAELEGHTPELLLAEAADTVEVPHGRSGPAERPEEPPEERPDDPASGAEDRAG